MTDTGSLVADDATDPEEAQASSGRQPSRNVRDQERVHALVGNPSEKVRALKERIQDENVREFRQVQAEFLDILWTLDTYRRNNVIPATPRLSGAIDRDQTGEGLYRGKGNIFSEIMTLILSNKTTSPLAPRTAVMGFSQQHQIDIAWPDRGTKVLRDPLICCEAKLTGAPGVLGGKPRGGLADWSNRRKELKFQATDLKLARQRASTSIHNWNAWRKKADPRVYTLWAARLEAPTPDGVDKQLAKMIREAQNLTATYSDGVGLFAFTPNPAETTYIPVLPPTDAASRVTSLDEVLDEIAGEIKERIEESGSRVPDPRK